ncbi:MAG: polymer-forming cytoskeletal protein [Burkholderiales bacterium]|nr:polymer-forming cytoskeletal protein [Burkholderiales bacterium]MCE7876829.1 polymer-forming cytoskeletal family protein [Betaproteobacteria bacterium PRO3]
MFSEKKHPPPQKRIDCLIGAGTSVRGDIVFTGGLRIDGRVEGNVSTAEGQAGTLVVSEQARIDGEVRVSHIVVNGTVNGPVAASDYLELQPKARVTGDVTYKTLEMHVGAVIQGRLNHGQAEPGSASVVELKRVGG